MKKIILSLLLIVLISNNVSAQESNAHYPNNNNEEIGELDKNNFPIGEWKYYLENGALEYTINWDTKYYKGYYANGILKEEGIFIPETGVHIGKWIVYSKNGKIKSKEVFDKKGKLIVITSY